MDHLRNFVTRAIGLIRVNPTLAFFVAAVLGAAVYIHRPFFSEREYISLEPGQTAFNFKPVPTSLTLRFDDSAHISEYSYEALIADSVGKNVPATIVPVPEPVDLLTIPFTIRHPKQKADILGVRLTITHKTPQRIKLVEAHLDGREVSLRSFRDNVKTSSAELKSTWLVREDLAKGIVTFNEPISNYLLAFMAILLIFLVSRSMFMGWILMRRDKGFEKHIYSKTKTDGVLTGATVSQFIVDYSQLIPRFRFWEILGPALGLCLTATSLIAALQPHTKETENVAGFMGSLHLAMIATALGLLIRILSTISRTLAHKIALRADSMYVFINLEDYQGKYKVN